MVVRLVVLNQVKLVVEKLGKYHVMLLENVIVREQEKKVVMLLGNFIVLSLEKLVVFMLVKTTVPQPLRAI